MDDQPATLGIQLAIEPDGDTEEVAEATLRLRRELLDLDVEAVEVPRAGEAPPGDQGGGAGGARRAGGHHRQVAAAGPVVAAIRAWLAGSPQRSIKLELDGDTLELTGLSSREQRRLTDEWLGRHTGT